MEEKSMMETVQSFAVKQALKYVEREPEKNLPKLLDWADKFDKENLYAKQREVFHHVLEHPEGNWYQLIMRVFQLDEGVRKAFLENFIINASLIGSSRQESARKKEGCNIPWAILLDPTSACNLRCTGCWAAEYGHDQSLSLETIDSIIRQGKAPICTSIPAVSPWCAKPTSSVCARCTLTVSSWPSPTAPSLMRPSVRRC